MSIFHCWDFSSKLEAWKIYFIVHNYSFGWQSYCQMQVKYWCSGYVHYFFATGGQSIDMKTVVVICRNLLTSRGHIFWTSIFHQYSGLGNFCGKSIYSHLSKRWLLDWSMADWPCSPTDWVAFYHLSTAWQAFLEHERPDYPRQVNQAVEDSIYDFVLINLCSYQTELACQFTLESMCYLPQRMNKSSLCNWVHVGSAFTSNQEIFLQTSSSVY